MVDFSLIDRLKAFIEYEGKSCSFDPELITPMYVYRMWGGIVTVTVTLKAIEQSMNIIK